MSVKNKKGSIHKWEGKYNSILFKKNTNLFFLDKLQNSSNLFFNVKYYKKWIWEEIEIG